MKYIRALIRRLIAFIYLSSIKIFNFSKLKFYPIQVVSTSTKFVIYNKGKIILGKEVGTRRNVEFRTSNGGQIIIGNKSFFNNGCLINSMERITIGDNTQLGPNVMVYDHDHDFRVEGGIRSGKFKKSSIKIGNNVWIGANCIILRGTVIGDNCIVAAGSVLTGKYPANTVIMQKRQTTIYEIN